METSLLGRPTFGGLASGLDTNALLEGLLAIERQPLQRIQSRRAEIDQQRSLMRDFNGRLVKLREAAQALDNRNTAGTNVSATEEFLRYAGSSTNEEVVTVSAGAGAAPGDIEIRVLQLAQGARVASTTYTSDTETNALAENESITISLADADPDAVPPVEATSIEVTAGAGGLSLQDLRDAINTSEGNGGAVRADVLKVDDDDFRLILTTTATGDSAEMTITGAFAEDPDRSVQPQNARFEIFGQVLTRETNFVEDALSGVTLRLEAPGDLPEGFTLPDGLSDEEVASRTDAARISEIVTIETDVDEVAQQLQAFVDAYNDVVSFVDRQFEYNETTNTAGPLSGDFTLRSVQAQLRGIISDPYGFTRNPSNPFATTSDGAEGGAISGIGIELEGGGRLKLNRETLEEALALDPLSVREFLSGRIGPGIATADDPDPEDVWEEGFATRVARELEQIVRSGDGTLATRDEAFASRLREFDDSIERFERRLGQREETLIQRFSELERIVASLQSQQGFLTSLG